MHLDITNRQRLAELLDEFKGLNIDEEDRDYKYIIYVRKSTDDKDKQVRSVQDQILECEKYAKENGLNYDPIDIVVEKQSAKEPDIRPKFRQVLTDIRDGKYDGIIAWHPDRLARNMKDAGEIIDMLDKQELKDLQFPGFHFQLSTAGLTLLGITFVMSKQYSDALSDGVRRGNRNSVLDGKHINKTKHGYYKDEEGYLRPDPKTFHLIEEAFQMRLEGQTLKNIGKYLESKNYTIKKANGRIDAKMDKQKVSKILRDPIYTGVLSYGTNHAVDLTQAANFVPAVSVKDFMRINQVDSTSDIFKMVKSYVSGEDIEVDVMRGMVMCDKCKKPRTIQMVFKQLKDGPTKYLTYRCDTKECTERNKSIRAKVIIDYIVAFLEQSPFSDSSYFDSFTREIENLNVIRLSDHKREQRALQARINKKVEKIEDVKNTIYKTSDKELIKAFSKDLKKYQKDLKSLELEKAKLKEGLSLLKQSPHTHQEFIELWEKVLKTLKNIDQTTTPVEIDFYIKKLYLNFFVQGKSVVNSTLCEPFDTLEQAKVSNGGR